MFTAFRSCLKNSRPVVRMTSTTSSTTKRLEGKVAIVTGSTDGIGFAIARRLGNDGAKVVVSSRKQENVDRAVAKLKEENIDVFGLVCHVNKAEDRKRLIGETLSRKGGIDIFVSNAGINPYYGPVFNCSEILWDKIFETNVKSAFLFCKDIVPHMQKRGGGSITIISSISGYTPIEMIAPYAVSKTALLGLVKAFVPQCASMNIRINGVVPGIIDTAFSKVLISDPKMIHESTPGIPLKRFGNVDDCAGLVSFLCSSDAAYMTGENIVVSGGMTSRL